MRLIDADALWEKIKEFRDDMPQATARKYVCNAIMSVIGDENRAPTIDAVPVVRCKDCKYRGREFKCPMCRCECCNDGDGYFDVWFEDETLDYSFCSRGERRDEDE